MEADQIVGDALEDRLRGMILNHPEQGLTHQDLAAGQNLPAAPTFSPSAGLGSAPNGQENLINDSQTAPGSSKPGRK